MHDTATPKEPFLFRSVNQLPEVILDASPDADLVWVPISEGVWTCPQVFDCSHGGWTNLIKIAPGCRLACHYHTGQVDGYTLKGSWRYLEHDWIANVGTFIYEPPGELHTLVADEELGMTTFFVSRGCLVFTDEDGRYIGFEDVFSRLERCRTYYRSIGRNPAELDRLIR